jgi:signal transduction histidine kinase
LAAIAAACVLIAYAPRLLGWPSTAIFAGSGNRADPFQTVAYLIGAVSLRTNLIGAVLARRRAESARDTAAAAERARIARELHDVVAHQMTVFVAQAQGAEVLVDSDPRQVRTALRTITNTTRDALVEMRRLVDVARPETPASVDVEQPQPGLAYDDYARLAEGAEAAGLTDVSFRLNRSGDRDPPAGVSLSVYRLIQEAVTNAAKHSPGATLDVGVRDRVQAVVVAYEAGVVRPGQR